MIKIKIWSDLHTDLGPEYTFPEVSKDCCDIVVLAGDIINSRKPDPFVDWVRSIEQEVVFVAGNHEHYGSDIEDSLASLKDISNQTENLHFLENESTFIFGIDFFGGTMWTDFGLVETLEEAEQAMIDAQIGMCDYSVIKLDGKPLSPRNTWGFNKQFRHALKQWDKKSSLYPRVVVTHHEPNRNPNTKWKNGELEPAFTNKEVRCYTSDTWVYGHTHEAADREVVLPFDGDKLLCRHVSNPRGYKSWRGWEVEDYDPKGKIITL